MSSPHKKFFSTDLQTWFANDKPKTVENITATFGLRAAPSIIVILMALPALPIPTGGVSHIMEIIAFLVAAQMVAGVDAIWVPKKWRSKEVSKKVLKTGIPIVIGNIKRVEKYSRARGTNFMTTRSTPRVGGLMMMIGIASAFFAPPFSGLDTFPALGVVLISLGLVLLDVSFLIIGCAVVLVSIILELTIGAALIVYLRNLILHGSKQSYVTAGVVLGILTVLFAVRWYRSHRG